MILALLLVLTLLVALSGRATCNQEFLPSISIPSCDTDSPAIINEMSLSNGSGHFPARTSISICWTPENLMLEYYCQDDLILRNDFLECNSPMYSQVTMLLISFLSGNIL
jgi:hypothetical protein